MQGAAVPRDELADATSPRKAKVLSGYRLAIAGIVLVVALAVLTASLRMTEGAIDRALAERKAARQWPKKAGRCSRRSGF